MENDKSNEISLAYGKKEISLDAAHFILICPEIYERNSQEAILRTAEEKKEEASRLVNALGVSLKYIYQANIRKVNPKTFLTEGHIDNLAEIIAEHDAQVAVVDTTITPVQQRNLEKILKIKVLDRTGLILEIFGDRALTKEGRLQVELAHLIYQKSRLVRTWTHLERQRGGLSFVGGPGESQLESDRRQIQTRILQLTQHLEKVRKTRALHRKGRDAVPFPVVALVGYTNAGKSTLFNKLSDSSVLAKDMLFATLDPTARKVCLPSGQEIIMTDTVGFISNLPTQLVEAFKATLEEVETADIILHVRDMSSSAKEAENQDVISILAQLGIDVNEDHRVIEVWNKSDVLSEDERQALTERISKLMSTRTDLIASPAPVLISSFLGDGFDVLEDRIDQIIGRDDIQMTITLAPSEGKKYAWLCERANIISETFDENYNRILNLKVNKKFIKPLEDI